MRMILMNKLSIHQKMKNDLTRVNCQKK